MPSEPETAALAAHPPAAVRRGRRLPIIWLVPIVAGAIAIWLAVATLREQGPTVIVSFRTAEGLEAGKTQVRYKDVDIGLLDSVRLTADRSRVEAIINMQKQAEPLMTAGTRFWVVRPRIGLSGVSGLGTLLSGAYIEIDPGPGERASEFTALEEPPPITSDMPGRRFTLEASALGSLARGEPVAYQGLVVGQILGVELAPNRRTFTVSVFVREEHVDLVRDTSRFWNASGIDVRLGPQGVDVAVESLESLAIGGVSFDTPGIEGPGQASAEDHVFPLYESRRRVDEPVFTQKIPYLVQFEGSVRGLQPGSAVEFGGLQVGTVTDVRLRLDEARRALVIPVTIDIEPQRIGVTDQPAGLKPYEIMAEFVRRGLRAQLKTGNLLTGDLLVDLAFHPDAAPAELEMDTGSFPQIPAIPTDLDEITRSVSRVLDEVAAAPLGELVTGLRNTVDGIDRIVNAPETTGTLTALSQSVEDLRGVLDGVSQDLGPLTNSLRTAADASVVTVRSANTALESINALIGRDSRVVIDVNRLMAELTATARSIRSFADYLDRNPDAIIRGRTGR